MWQARICQILWRSMHMKQLLAVEIRVVRTKIMAEKREIHSVVASIYALIMQSQWFSDFSDSTAIYVTTLLSMSALCIPLSAFVTNVHLNGDRSLPGWLARFLFRRVVGQSSDAQQVFSLDQQPRQQPQKEDNESAVRDIHRELRFVRQHCDKIDFEGDKVGGWKDAAIRIDRILFKIYAVVLTIVTGSCLGMMIDQYYYVF